MEQLMRTFVIMIGILFIGCHEKHIKSPRIQFNEREYNFGEIADVEKVTHVFKFKNIGGDTLVIDDVRAP